MKTLKVMGIIGIVLAALSLFCLVAYDNPVDYTASVGWGIYAALYLLAFSIVGVVQAKNKS